ncbi:MAG: hypothetical protein HC869_10780 [Rhodospirillales bacterium]|nr:hypothetical protein [Rhodospirillales bacterium]
MKVSVIVRLDSVRIAFRDGTEVAFAPPDCTHSVDLDALDDQTLRVSRSICLGAGSASIEKVLTIQLEVSTAIVEEALAGKGALNGWVIDFPFDERVSPPYEGFNVKVIWNLPEKQRVLSVEMKGVFSLAVTGTFVGEHILRPAGTMSNARTGC